MNLLKSLGGSSGNAMSSIGGSRSVGSKNNYFSNIKLSQDDTDKKQKNKQNSKGDKRKGPPKDFVPNKFALKLNPPTIVLQYMNPQNNKLYHHHMRLKKLKKDTNTKDALDFLKKKHSLYFAPKVIDEQQIEKLIERLKKDLINNDKSQMQEVQQQGDFDFDYDDDFDDLGDN